MLTHEPEQQTLPPPQPVPSDTERVQPRDLGLLTSAHDADRHRRLVRVRLEVVVRAVRVGGGGGRI